MKKTLDRAEDKIQKICDALKNETIEPARHEAERIIVDAKAEAEAIVRDAEKQKDKILHDARLKVDQERNVFHSSLEQAAAQTLEALRQSIEKRLFDKELGGLLAEATSDPQVIAKFIDCIIQAIEKEGTGADFEAIIPKKVDPKEVVKHLLAEVVKKLNGQTVVLGDISGGAQVKIRDKRMTIDISDAVLQQILARYVSKDIRELVFGEKG